MIAFPGQMGASARGAAGMEARSDVIFDWLAGLCCLFLIVVALTPLIQRRALQLRRSGSVQRLGRARGSRVLTLIHRRETYSLLGVPLRRLDEADAPERALRAIRQTPDDQPIDLVLHAPPGANLAAEQIAHALIRHPARVAVLIPHYAAGNAALIALAADEILLDANAVLGPIDVRVGRYPAASLLALAQQKEGAALEDRSVVLIDQARRALAQAQTVVGELLLARGLAPEEAAKTAAALAPGAWTGHYPILIEEARRLGLPVVDALPAEVYRLMDLYDAGDWPRPSTSVVPLAREGEE